ncbi:hypothetical protein GCM10015535_47940 [Streptomyces gelaticus]|uniref:Lipoprotein n=1 Tax=Streptomyces gelaticus TaxID=285446 RepID=A0ABQ2W3E3_9ACTN|nr:hypothetical protein [Streptomyces gelaticus]GGV90870.1 hypothetical protein GCM10015535_47940 [Streptomyces gelaticus]
MRRMGTTRRGVFTATGAIALGAVLAGCGDGPGSGKESGRSGAATAAEQASVARAEKRIRAAAVRTSLELLGGYEHVIRAHPATAAGLSPLRDAVRAHAKALVPAGGQSLALGRSRATDAGGALRDLAAAERRAADAHLAALLEAPPELARLLASIAAAGAAHAYLLTELAKENSS